jgi:ABC-2 type transport system permease protein
MRTKVLHVVRREYLQQIKTKGFWIGTILIPSLGLVFVYLQVILASTLIPEGKIGVVDLTGRLYEPLLAEQKAVSAADEKGKDEGKERTDEVAKQGRRAATKITFFRVDARAETLSETRKQLNERVQKKEIKAYIVIPADGLTSGKVEWRARSVKADMILRESVERALGRAGTKERLKDQGVDPAVYEKARLTVSLDPHEATEKETSEDAKNVGANLAVSGVLFFLIYISIFVYGAFIMRGVLEEKNNRIVEVIISSVRPTELMLGKIVGIGLVGLTQYAVWALFAFALTLPGIVGMMGLTGGGLPSIPGATILAFVVFFLLGYFLYAGLYAALAAPFNTEQEAQQLVMIPGMMLILASTMWFFAFNTPDGTLARVLSLFPFTAPLLMFMRISVQPPPAWEIALSIAILLLTIWGVAWFAGRVYRVGILMYGKKPTFPEIIRWARAAD